MILSPTAHYAYITLTDAPSLAGEMAYQDADGGTLERPLLVAMDPSSGSVDSPVFGFNDVENMVIPTESESFGSVKALFR